MKSIFLSLLTLTCTGTAAELIVNDHDLPRVPPTTPDKAAATFLVREDFRVEVVASEPLIVDPVAIAFDENGRLFAVEMGDYSERRDERLGRVKLLEDRDGDGRFDHATVFAKDLAWPTAVICWNGGVFVCAAPDVLFLKDTSGDGVADERRVVFTGFGNAAPKLNVQQLPNSFTWGLDNRIHGALGGNASVITNLAVPERKLVVLRSRDFSFDPRTFDLRAETGGGQWGLAFDDAGRKFVCSNARHIIADMYDAPAAARNRFYSMPPPDVDIASDGPAAEIFRLSPEEPWRVLRTKWRVEGLVSGPVEGGGRVSGYFTGATGITIYRGDAFPEEFRGDAFVADCGSNLIHRKKLRREGLRFVAERAPDEARREFLASRDNWFRPTTLVNAPDGTLYVVDMYREVIEHPWSLPPAIKSRLDLNSGNDRGRIHRIAPSGFQQPAPVRLGNATVAELVNTLAHANGWHRDTAARLLLERDDTNAVPLLRQTMRGATSSVARVHALHTLQSFGALSLDDRRHAQRDSNAHVRVHVVRSAQRDDAEALSSLRSLATDPDIRVRYELALLETDAVTLTRLIQQDVEEPWMRAAVLGGMANDAADAFAALAGDTSFGERTGATDFLTELARIAGASAPWSKLALGLRVSARAPAAVGYAEAMAAGLEARGVSLAAVDRRLFEEMSQRARNLLADARESSARRVEAAAFLARGADAASLTALLELLAPSTAAEVQLAAIHSLLRRGAATNVLARWTQLPPATRTKAASAFVSRRESALALINALEHGTVTRAEISASDVQRLRAHRDGAVRERAARVWQAHASSRAAVVEKFRPALELRGDATRGRTVYAARCASCHRVGNEGVNVGPDLASVATAGREKLLASILDPNVEVAAAFVAYAVETKDGQSFTGLIVGEDPQAVTLKLPSGETLRAPRDHISSLRAGNQSLMPEGLEEGLSVQDMADLLEFITMTRAH